MAGQPGFFDLSDRYEALSAAGDPLERLAAVVDFEVFRGPLVAALRRSVRGKGGRPPFDPVLMFKILVLQALYSLSDEATEFQIKDRLSFQRFLGLGLDGTVPDATTVWLFRERLVQAKAIDKLFEGFPPEDPDPLARLERFFRQRAALVREAPVIARLAFTEKLPHAAGPQATKRRGSPATP